MPKSQVMFLSIENCTSSIYIEDEVTFKYTDKLE